MKNKVIKQSVVMIKKSLDSKKVDTSELLENIFSAINVWAQACIDQDETPVCITSFASINSKIEVPCNIKSSLLGETPEVTQLLKSMNEVMAFKVAEESHTGNPKGN